MTMRDGLDPKKGRVDWAKISSISREEIEEQAALEKAELGINFENSTARPVFRCPDIKGIRERLGLSQNQFADRYALSRRTIQQWEQRRSQPDHPARILLQAIASEPELMARVINGLRKKPASWRKPISALLDSTSVGHAEEVIVRRGGRWAVKSAVGMLLGHEISTFSQHGASALVDIKRVFGCKNVLKTTAHPNAERSLISKK